MGARSRAKEALFAVAASAAAGYLWAVLFGDGLPGLKDTVGLADSDSYPDANVAFLVAAGVYLGSPVCAVWWADALHGRGALLKWLGATAFAR
jgi:hypothetical protein